MAGVLQDYLLRREGSTRRHETHTEQFPVSSSPRIAHEVPSNPAFALKKTLAPSSVRPLHLRASSSYAHRKVVLDAWGYGSHEFEEDHKVLVDTNGGKLVLRTV